MMLNNDLLKLSQLVSSFTDEQCYEVEVRMENIENSISEVQKQIRNKIFSN